MFAISNTIAYSGDLMVFGTPTRAEFPGKNTWFDIQSAVADGNWVHGRGGATSGAAGLAGQRNACARRAIFG
ncbi:hypothetical protein ACIRRA_43920 [Nocardia sp. NPDC101769]|uniref:hypothetical protein n=1 Tax=Nocardia sp. NPDC101769 TaxID=3364333 RepID=UPI0038276F1E